MYLPEQPQEKLRKRNLKKEREGSVTPGATGGHGVRQGHFESVPSLVLFLLVTS